jgi:peptide/nickel transport system permease protein
VIWRHVFRNVLLAVSTVLGLQIALMLGGAVLIETVFAWPGIGRLLYEGITFRDFPIVQGVVILGGAMIVLVNLVVDILYAIIDPRIRLGT